jgi:hypothetical protein
MFFSRSARRLDETSTVFPQITAQQIDAWNARREAEHVAARAARRAALRAVAPSPRKEPRPALGERSVEAFRKRMRTPGQKEARRVWDRDRRYLAPPPEGSETIRQAIATIDELCPWLAGVERDRR